MFPGAFPVGLAAAPSSKLSPSPPTPTGSIGHHHHLSALSIGSSGVSTTSGLLQWPSPHTVHDILATSIAALPNPGTAGSTASSTTSSSSHCPSSNNPHSHNNHSTTQQSHSHHHNNNNSSNNNNNNNNNSNNNDNRNNNDSAGESNNNNNVEERLSSVYYSHNNQHSHHSLHSHHSHQHHPQQYYASAALYHHHHNHPGAATSGLAGNATSPLAFQSAMMQVTASQPGSPCNWRAISPVRFRFLLFELVHEIHICLLRGRIDTMLLNNYQLNYLCQGHLNTCVLWLGFSHAHGDKN